MAKGKTEKRRRLAEAQNWRCCYCGGRLHEDGTRMDGATIEHVVPRVEGGSNAQSNLVVACRACNGARSGFYSVQIFYKLRRNRLRKGRWPPCSAAPKEVRFLMAYIFAEAELQRLDDERRDRGESSALAA